MDTMRQNQVRGWDPDQTSEPSSPKGRKRRPYNSTLTPLTPYQQELAVQFLPLARTLAKPLKQMFRHWRDDFESAACLALVEAARSFDPTRNTRFATFARFRIRGALNDVGRSMELAGWEGVRERVPEVHRLTALNEEFGIVLNTREDPEVGTDLDSVDAVEKWLTKLPRRNAEVCRLYYLEGKTRADIAEIMDISQSEVTRLHRQALEFLSHPITAGDKPRPEHRRARRASGVLRSWPAMAV